MRDEVEVFRAVLRNPVSVRRSRPVAIAAMAVCGRLFVAELDTKPQYLISTSDVDKCRIRRRSTRGGRWTCGQLRGRGEHGSLLKPPWSTSFQDPANDLTNHFPLHMACQGYLCDFWPSVNGPAFFKPPRHPSCSATSTNFFCSSNAYI